LLIAANYRAVAFQLPAPNKSPPLSQYYRDRNKTIRLNLKKTMLGRHKSFVGTKRLFYL
jgi:hypothetical protein